MPIFSIAGKLRGVSGHGKLMASSIKYIRRKRPRVSVMENVKNLASKRFRGVLRGTTKALEGLGYKVFTKVLDSSSFGVPQQRKRLFLVSIREDSVRHEFQWPSSKKPKFNMDDFLDPIVPGDRPGRLPSSDRGRRHCKAAYRKVFANGIDPKQTPVLVDVDCSDGYRSVGVNIAKTLTRSRGEVGGPWVSTRGRRTTISELMRIQGFTESEVPWQEAGISAHQIGAMLGNSVSVPVIGAVLANAMFAGGLTRKCYKLPAFYDPGKVDQWP